MAGRSHLFMLSRSKKTRSSVSPNIQQKNETRTDGPTSSSSVSSLIIKPGYNKLSESLRKKTPSAVICKGFCGGRKCRFDTYDSWSAQDMAIDGLFSHWVTDEILATSRPNWVLIQQKNLVDQFIQCGIKTIVNLQTLGEHAHCGPPLTSSGFSYQPEAFMERDIYFYNFGWKDYDHGSLNGLLDAVKVLTFAVTQGKVAVHCHAGLGRTGVLIGCYLIYNRRLRAEDAINFVRQKRPNAVQTSSQITMIQQFEEYLSNCLNTYPLFSKMDDSESLNDAKSQPFTLEQHLESQKEILHGYEARPLRHIPKIVYVICERLLLLCRADPTPKLNYWMDENRPPFTQSFINFTKRLGPSLPIIDEMTFQQNFDHRLQFFGDVSAILSSENPQVSLEEVIQSVLAAPPLDLKDTLADYWGNLDGRHSGWSILSLEKEPSILATLLWTWLLRLKKPVLTNDELSVIVIHAENPRKCFAHFHRSTGYTVEYLLRFIQRLCLANHSALPQVARRLAGVLSQRCVDDVQSPGCVQHKRLGQGTLTRLLDFLTLSLKLIAEPAHSKM